MGRRPPAHLRLAKVAARQHRLFTLAQALDVGVSRPTVRRRLAEGTWLEVEPRVYVAALGPPLSALERLHARCLATGGFAAGRSAAALYGLLPHPATPEVLVLRRSRTRRHHPHHAIAVRTSNVIDTVDVTTVARVPALRPERMLLTLAEVRSLPMAIVGDAVDTAIVRGIVDAARLERRARELDAPRRFGCRVVLDLLATRHPDLARARNEWEARFLRRCEELGLPRPVPNFEVQVGGRRRFLDAAFVEQRVFAEWDGFEPHSQRRMFDDDRDRQNELTADGWLPFRFTAVTMGRPGALDPLARALEARGAVIRPRPAVAGRGRTRR